MIVLGCSDRMLAGALFTWAHPFCRTRRVELNFYGAVLLVDGTERSGTTGGRPRSDKAFSRGTAKNRLQ